MKHPGWFVLLPMAAYACINDVRESVEPPLNRLRGSELIAHFRQVIARKSSDPALTAKFAVRPADTEEVRQATAAVAKILSGEARVGRDMLLQVEARWPGSYATAANLGTAYELAHDDDKALSWISVGIQRNPQDHHGTEWLHVVILKAKIEADKHPKEPIKARLLDLPQGLNYDTKVSVDGKTHTVHEIADALYYQLTERMLFVKPKDPFVADLLYSYAMIEANAYTPKTALELLKLAREYGFVDEALLKQREQEYAVLASQNPRAAAKTRMTVKE